MISKNDLNAFEEFTLSNFKTDRSVFKAMENKMGDKLAEIMESFISLRVMRGLSDYKTVANSKRMVGYYKFPSKQYGKRQHQVDNSAALLVIDTNGLSQKRASEVTQEDIEFIDKALIHNFYQIHSSDFENEIEEHAWKEVKFVVFLIQKYWHKAYAKRTYADYETLKGRAGAEVCKEVIGTEWLKLIDKMTRLDIPLPLTCVELIDNLRERVTDQARDVAVQAKTSILPEQEALLIQNFIKLYSKSGVVLVKALINTYISNELRLSQADNTDIIYKAVWLSKIYDTIKNKLGRKPEACDLICYADVIFKEDGENKTLATYRDIVTVADNLVEHRLYWVADEKVKLCNLLVWGLTLAIKDFNLLDLGSYSSANLYKYVCLKVETWTQVENWVDSKEFVNDINNIAHQRNKALLACKKEELREGDVTIIEMLEYIHDNSQLITHSLISIALDIRENAHGYRHARISFKQSNVIKKAYELIVNYKKGKEKQNTGDQLPELYKEPIWNTIATIQNLYDTNTTIKQMPFINGIIQTLLKQKKTGKVPSEKQKACLIREYDRLMNICTSAKPVTGLETERGESTGDITGANQETKITPISNSNIDIFNMVASQENLDSLIDHSNSEEENKDSDDKRTSEIFGKEDSLCDMYSALGTGAFSIDELINTMYG